MQEARLPQTDPEDLRRHGVSARRFQAAYAETPPWDIGVPQPEVVRLIEAGTFQGDVLDAGCGTGENAIRIAAAGHHVLGVDFVAVAIERAIAKATALGSTAEFRVHDVLQLGTLGMGFDTILDCGVFHTFSDADRPNYVTSLGKAIRPGGSLILMCFSELETRPGGPRRVTQDELRNAFADGWTIDSISPARFAANIFEDGARAWLAILRKDN